MWIKHFLLILTGNFQFLIPIVGKKLFKKHMKIIWAYPVYFVHDQWNDLGNQYVWIRFYSEIINHQSSNSYNINTDMVIMMVPIPALLPHVNITNGAWLKLTHACREVEKGETKGPLWCLQNFGRISRFSGGSEWGSVVSDRVSRLKWEAPENWLSMRADH